MCAYNETRHLVMRLREGSDKIEGRTRSYPPSYDIQAFLLNDVRGCVSHASRDSFHSVRSRMVASWNSYVTLVFLCASLLEKYSSHWIAQLNTLKH